MVGSNLGILWLAVVPAYHHMVFFLCISVPKFPFFFNTDTSQWIRAHSNQVSPNFNLIISGKTLFLNKFTFTETGGKDINLYFWMTEFNPHKEGPNWSTNSDVLALSFN